MEALEQQFLSFLMKDYVKEYFTMSREYQILKKSLNTGVPKKEQLLILIKLI